MLAYIFPGQGAQVVGMGKELLNDFVTLERKASEILGYSIKSLCLDDPHKSLNNTAYTQPALFTVNALTYIKHFENTGVDPDYLAGHSLGEYNALFAAEVFDFPTALRLVQKRGELMAKARDGGMVAVVGSDLSGVVEVIKGEAPNIDIANYNSDVQLVLSGPKDELNSIQELVESKGCRFIPLAVSAAFHSRYMASAATEFREFLKTVEIGSPKATVIANVTAKAYPLEPDAIRDLLAAQITSSVRWTDTVRLIRQADVVEFVEMGPGKVLTGLLKNIA